MLFDKYKKLKEDFAKKGTEAFNSLVKEIREKQKNTIKHYVEQLSSDRAKQLTIYNKVVLTPKEYLDFIYNNDNFKEYLRNLLGIKEISKKIAIFGIVVIVLALLIAILIFKFVKLGIVSIILGLAVIIGAMVLVGLSDVGISYEDFYCNTMSNLLLAILPGYNFKELDKEEKNSTNNEKSQKQYTDEQMNHYKRLKKIDKVYFYSNRKILTLDELKKHFSKVFDNYKETNTLVYNSVEAAGGICDLEITKKVEKKDEKTGKVEVKNETILDGFYLKNEIKEPGDLLHKAVIEIREDDNALSALTENTVHGVYKSDKEYMFNSEELNKALDCRIKGQNFVSKAIDKGYNMVEDKVKKMMGKEVEERYEEENEDLAFNMEKVMTSTFEEHLIFLRNRYNSFNMDIADSFIEFNVNLKKSLFQKFQSKELLSKENEYKKETKSITFVKPRIFDNEDIEYYKVFPMLEKIFFIHYINLIHRLAVKYDDVTTVELDVADRYEKEITDIMEEDYKEFKSWFKEEIKQLSEEVKNLKEF